MASEVSSPYFTAVEFPTDLDHIEPSAMPLLSCETPGESPDPSRLALSVDPDPGCVVMRKRCLMRALRVRGGEGPKGKGKGVP